MTMSQQDSPNVPSSPEDGSNFKRSLQIDMKGLVGDAVGNVSPLVLVCFQDDLYRAVVDEHQSG